ncbi:hypothetical protein FQN54_009789 [Arachnomyces sp. PD_36]|nr:hypothetical protein FQN54_009789 [Arachnomyces sp. PD_36]
MAALAHSPLSTIRQPFGLVNNARLQSLASKQNSQQNIQFDNNTPGKPISRKRSHTSPDSDEENIAPVHHDSSAKRSRAHGDDDVSKSPFSKTPRLILNRVETSTPRSKKPSTPVSAPVRRLAGRSPTRKVGNAFSRRSSGGAASYKRIDPPLRTKGQTCPAPFSLAEALRGPANRDPQPKSWQFEIHVDTEQQEMANLMEHSTCVLDISDDEGKAQNAGEGRGKENIPPQEGAVGGAMPSTVVASSRKDMMTDETRTPLGELNPSDFCPEGVDATSCIVYEEDEKCPSSKDEVAAPAPEPKAAEPTPTPTTTTTEPSLLTTAAVSALIQSTAPVMEEQVEKQEPAAIDAATVPLPTDSEIEIWESGSATEEAAAATTEAPVESIFS